jgi:hypothetical protein
MQERIRDHIRANVVGYVALFFALTLGTAYTADGPLPGQNRVGSADIINQEVKTVDLVQGAVTTGRLRNQAVRTEKIADGQVQAPDLGGDSVGSANVIPNSLTDGDLASNSVGFLELQFDSVSASKVLNESLTAGDLGPNSVGTSEVIDNSLTGADIANGTVSAADLASSFPAVRASHDELQEIPNGGLPTKLQFNSEVYDTRSLHSVSGANNSRLLAPTDGIYVITGGVQWEDNGDGDGWRSLFIHPNGLPGHLASSIMAPAAAGVTTANSADTHQVVTTQAKLNAGDYVELFAFQNSGSAKNILGVSPGEPEFSMTWLAPG